MFVVPAHSVNSTEGRAAKVQGETAALATVDASDLFIPYGTGRLTPDLMTIVRDPDGGETVDCRVPFMIADSAGDGTFRLNSGRRDDLRGVASPGQGEEADALAALRDVVTRQCDLWSRSQARFVERYFAFVSGQVTRHRDELERRLARFGGLYGYSDWVFSAPLPLPRAHLPVADMGGGPGRRIRVDFAFWSRGRLVAIDLIGSATITAERVADRDDLRAAGVEVIEVRDDDLTDDGGLSGLLPADFHTFWRDQPLPIGPFAPNLSPP